jgi:hypothetical protein
MDSESGRPRDNQLLRGVAGDRASHERWDDETEGMRFAGARVTIAGRINDGTRQLKGGRVNAQDRSPKYKKS